MTEKVMSPIGVEGGPSQAEIDQWKTQFGDVYVASFDKDKYVYRPLRRFEYKQILSLGQAPDNRSFVEEKIVSMCTLWPKIEADKLATLKAGVISTLVDLVMVASNFGVTEEPVKL